MAENTNTPTYQGSSASGAGGGNSNENGNAPNNPKRNKKNPTDGDGNEISPNGKFWAGSLLIAITFLSALYLIAHWPDRLVSPRDNMKPLYIYDWFHVRLAGIPDTGTVRYLNDSVGIAVDPGYVPIERKNADTTAKPQNLSDSTPIDTTPNPNSLQKAGITNPSIKFSSKVYPPESELMHINTLLLILVALGGFLGNMIHISSSFTNYIGNGEFKKRWTLWYVVKPFTAAALAIAIYFVFRGGFLNMSDETTNINLYGLMTISILAGLFTDRTTLKLKEVFEVLLRPREERANPMVTVKPQVKTVTAAPLELGKPATITIQGQNLDSKPVTIKIEGQEVTGVVKQPAVISFTYTLPAELKDKNALTLEILDENNQPIYPNENLPVKKDSNSPTGPADENQNEFGDADSNNVTNTPQD